MGRLFTLWAVCLKITKVAKVFWPHFDTVKSAASRISVKMKKRLFVFLKLRKTRDGKS
jgi:hypothetical protein